MAARKHGCPLLEVSAASLALSSCLLPWGPTELREQLIQGTKVEHLRSVDARVFDEPREHAPVDFRVYGAYFGVVQSKLGGQSSEVRALVVVETQIRGRVQ